MRMRFLAVVLLLFYRRFKNISHDKLQVSWKVLSVWQAETPPVQAAALDFDMAVGLCVAVATWRMESGIALLLCLMGIPRISESLTRVWDHVFFVDGPRPSVVLTFRRTKRGVFEKW